MTHQLTFDSVYDYGTEAIIVTVELRLQIRQFEPTSPSTPELRSVSSSANLPRHWALMLKPELTFA